MKEKKFNKICFLILKPAFVVKILLGVHVPSLYINQFENSKH